MEPSDSHAVSLFEPRRLRTVTSGDPFSFLICKPWDAESGTAPGSRLIAWSNASTSRTSRGRRESIASQSTGVETESQLMSIHRNSRASGPRADVAQTAEQLTCNQQVAGSIPAVGSCRGAPSTRPGRRSSEWETCGSSSVGRASAFQAERRGFDSRLPLSGKKLEWAQVAQSAEHVLGKDEVGGSIPLLGFLNSEARRAVERRREWSERGERYPSGQREQTVNLSAYAFGGSNPPLSMKPVVEKRSLRS